MNRALLVTAAVLMVSGASAQSPNANPHGKDHAADPAKAADKTKDGAEKAADKTKDGAEKAADKTKEGAAKAADKAKEGADKAVDKTKEGLDKVKDGSDRAARRANEHAAQKGKLAAMLKAPPDAAMKQELRRHAERVARIERVKTVAVEAKDTDAADRATKLLAKENERHDKWMSKQAATTTMTTTTTTAAPAAQPVKEGAK